MARKFIILDLGADDAVKVAALGFAFLASGAVYWLFEGERKKLLENECSENP